MQFSGKIQRSYPGVCGDLNITYMLFVTVLQYLLSLRVTKTIRRKIKRSDFGWQ